MMIIGHSDERRELYGFRDEASTNIIRSNEVSKSHLV